MDNCLFFNRDKKTVNATIRSIEVIGEAAKHIPQDIQARAPDAPKIWPGCGTNVYTIIWLLIMRWYGRRGR